MRGGDLCSYSLNSLELLNRFLNAMQVLCCYQGRQYMLHRVCLGGQQSSPCYAPYYHAHQTGLDAVFESHHAELMVNFITHAGFWDKEGQGRARKG